MGHLIFDSVKSPPLPHYRPRGGIVGQYIDRCIRESGPAILSCECRGPREESGVFLSIISCETYAVLRGLLAPDKPADKDLKTLTDTLTKHFEPSKLLIAERFHFHRRTQGSEESIADFVAGLRKLSIHCKFSGFLDDSQRDRFVRGLRSEQIQRKLLTQAELTFSQAVDMAQATEAAKRDTRQFQEQGTSIQAIQSHPPHPRSEVN